MKELKVIDEHTQEVFQQIAAVISESIDEAKRTFNETIVPALESIRSIGSAVEETLDLPRPPAEIKRDIKHEKNPMRLQQLNKELNKSYKAYRRFRKAGK